LLPVLMLPRSVMLIGTAPDGAKYTTAAFRFGDRASIVDR
jgi:hypothetical protein